MVNTLVFASVDGYLVHCVSLAAELTTAKDKKETKKDNGQKQLPWPVVTVGKVLKSCFGRNRPSPKADGSRHLSA